MDRFDKQINIHYNGRSKDVLPNTGMDSGSYLPLPLGEGRGEGIQKTSNHTPRKHTQTDRTLSPQQLIYYRDNWYIAAYCHYRKELRVFAIDNISSSKILEQTAESIDPEQVDQFLTSAENLGNGAIAK